MRDRLHDVAGEHRVRPQTWRAWAVSAAAWIPLPAMSPTSSVQPPGDAEGVVEVAADDVADAGRPVAWRAPRSPGSAGSPPASGCAAARPPSPPGARRAERSRSPLRPGARARSASSRSSSLKRLSDSAVTRLRTPIRSPEGVTIGAWITQRMPIARSIASCSGSVIEASSSSSVTSMSSAGSPRRIAAAPAGSLVRCREQAVILARERDLLGIAVSQRDFVDDAVLARQADRTPVGQVRHRHLRELLQGLVGIERRGQDVAGPSQDALDHLRALDRA